MILYQSYKNFHKIIEIISEQLEEKKNIDQQILILCPSPSQCDDFYRGLLKEAPDNPFLLLKITVLPFFSFIQYSLGPIFPEILEKFYSKAENFKELCRFFVLESREISYFELLALFEEFTFLRSFFTSSYLLEEIYEEKTLEYERISSFWNYFEKKQILDESALYEALTWNLKEGKLKELEYSSLFLWGCHHLTLSQIQFFKELSNFWPVVLLHSDIFERLLPSTTFLSWMKEERKGAGNLSFLLEEECSKNPHKVFQQEKGFSFLEEEMKTQEIKIFLKDAEREEEFLSLGNIFSVSQSFWQTDLEKVKNAYLENETLEINFFSLEIQRKIALQFEELKLEIFKKSKISYDEMLCLFYIIELNLPKLQYANFEDQQRLQFFFMRNIDYIESFSNEKYFVLLKDSLLESKHIIPKKGWKNTYYSFFESLGPLYQGLIEKILFFSFVKKTLTGESLLFIEGKGQKIDYALQELNHSFLFNSFIKKDYSVTQLASYLKCPYQFYLENVEEMKSREICSERMEVFEEGNLLHEAISFWYEKRKNWTKDLFGEFLENFLSLNYKKIGSFDKRELFEKISSYLQQTIVLLGKLEKETRGKWTFEKSLYFQEIKGRIDLYIESEDQIFLVEFKKGVSSLPKMANLKEQEIQIPFYYQAVKEEMRAKKKEDKSLFVLAICFQDFEESYYLGPSELPFLSQYLKFHFFEENFLVFEKINEIKKNIQEQKFFPKPQSDQVCLYCSFKAFCPEALS